MLALLHLALGLSPQVARARTDYSNKLVLTSFKQSLPTELGGRCMDGTMAGYFFRAGDPDLFIIFLEGGGACSNERDCTQRSKSGMGSSQKWPQTVPGTGGKFGLQSSNCTLNPDFCRATMVYMKYCTGDVHSGNNTSPSPSSWGFYFDGHANLARAVDALEQNHGLGAPGVKVLLSGGSAGGIGTFRNIDWLASRLPNAVVKGAPNAGWFFPGSLPGDEPSDALPPSDWAHFEAGTHGSPLDNATAKALLYGGVWNARGLVPADCQAAQGGGDNWTSCASVHTQYKYITTPLFVLENQYDTNQINGQMGAPTAGANASEQLVLEQYVAMYGEAMRNSTAQVLNDAPLTNKSQPDGIYHPSCYGHPVTEGIALDNHANYLPVLADWFFERNTMSHRLVERCAPTAGVGELPCNPACKWPRGDETRIHWKQGITGLQTDNKIADAMRDVNQLRTDPAHVAE